MSTLNNPKNQKNHAEDGSTVQISTETPNLFDCGKCPNSGGCQDTCMKATKHEGPTCTACHNTRDCFTFETNAHGVCICCACLSKMADEDQHAFWDTGIL